jgi:hypothetical protein
MNRPALRQVLISVAVLAASCAQPERRNEPAAQEPASPCKAAERDRAAVATALCRDLVGWVKARQACKTSADCAAGAASVPCTGDDAVECASIPLSSAAASALPEEAARLGRDKRYCDRFPAVPQSCPVVIGGVMGSRRMVCLDGACAHAVALLRESSPFGPGK